MINELFLARDIINMAKAYSHNFDVIENLSDLSFNCGQLFAESDNNIDWDTIFHILDQSYSSKDSSVLLALDRILVGINDRIINQP